MENIAKEILQFKAEQEKRFIVPTLDEIAEAFVKKNLPELKKAATVTTPELHEQLRCVLTKTDANAPQSEEFMANVPIMHLSWSALEEISDHLHMRELYSLILVKIYKGHIPFEIEKNVLALENDYLIQQLTKDGHEWSHRAKTIMAKFHPQSYKKFFEQNKYEPSGLMI